jgi:hypothetical protein
MPRPKKKGVIGIKIRLAAELISKLEAAAGKSGHSFNAEAAIRLGRSFAEEQTFGGEAGRRLMYFLATAFVHAGGNYHRNQLSPKQKPPPGEGPNVSLWIDDPEAYQAGMMNVIEQMMFHQPDVTYEKCIEQWKVFSSVITTHFVKQPGWERVDKEGSK